MTDVQHARAWSLFWQEQGQDSRCLAQAPAEIRDVLDDHWHSFAATLGFGAKVLDIGCGAGAVGRALAAASHGLRITGVDFAAVPPSRFACVELRAGVLMESMPFTDASFHAGVSQFGFEYGRIDEAAREFARVLRPGASFSFLVHHAEARIATDSGPHRLALNLICGSRLEAAFLSGSMAELDREISVIQRQCPHEKIVDFAASGLRSRVNWPTGQRAQIWSAVKEALAPEFIMLAALEAASVSPERLSSWLTPLKDHFVLAPPAVLRMASGVPICWKIEGKRKPG